MTLRVGIEGLLRDLGWQKVQAEPAMWVAPGTTGPRMTTDLAVHRATKGLVRDDRKYTTDPRRSRSAGASSGPVHGAAESVRDAHGAAGGSDSDAPGRPAGAE